MRYERVTAMVEWSTKLARTQEAHQKLYRVRNNALA